MFRMKNTIVLKIKKIKQTNLIIQIIDMNITRTRNRRITSISKQTDFSAQAALVHFNIRAGSIFPVPVCIVSPGHCVNKADTQKD